MVWYAHTQPLNCFLLRINSLYPHNGINYELEFRSSVRIKLPIIFFTGHRLPFHETIPGKWYTRTYIRGHSVFSSYALVTVKFIIINFPIYAEYRRMDVTGR